VTAATTPVAASVKAFDADADADADAADAGA
jgi:hypothetical protein